MDYRSAFFRTNNYAFGNVSGFRSFYQAGSQSREKCNCNDQTDLITDHAVSANGVRATETEPEILSGRRVGDHTLQM
jgi:hypothetical protein